MRQRPVIAVFTLAFATILPALAWAIPGYSTADVNLRTGPSMANPVVTTIPHGAPVQILGCLSGWSWCDTAWAGYRGWVAGAYLSASWQGKAVPFVIYAPRLRVPVVAYNGPAYRRRHYVGKPRFVVRPYRPINGCVRGRYGRVVCR